MYFQRIRRSAKLKKNLAYVMLDFFSNSLKSTKSKDFINTRII